VEVTHPGVLNLVQRTIPEPAPGQVRIRVEACGICPSDSATVDGILPGMTQEKVLTAQARQAVAKLAEARIAFPITSGRAPRGMQTLIRDLNITTLVAGFNGGVFVTPRLDPIVMRDLPKDASARTIELIEDYGLVAWLYTDTTWYVQDPKGPPA
jgi:haloacid dehalogenase-like hydrolase